MKSMKSRDDWKRVLTLAVERYPKSFTTIEAGALVTSRTSIHFMLWDHFMAGHLTSEDPDGDYGPWTLSKVWLERAKAFVREK